MDFTQGQCLVILIFGLCMAWLGWGLRGDNEAD